MNKSIWQIIMLVATVCGWPSRGNAQFETGNVYLGPHLGLGSYESAISIGGNIEYALTKPGEAGSGRIGIGAAVDYWEWGGDAGSGYHYTYTWLPIHAFGAYHFALPQRKWDLFAGLGLGYIIIGGTLDAPDGSSDNIFTEDAYSSHLFWTGVAGARYFFSPALSAQANLGFGISILSLGVDFTL